jgi:hypothetical protein
MIEPCPQYRGADWNRNEKIDPDLSGGTYGLYHRMFPGRSKQMISGR